MRKRITRIKLNIFFELKGLKIYWMQILISLFILPLSFLFILLLSGVSTSEMLSIWLSGFIVASLVGAFLGALALRVCNLMQPEILEL
jgi:ABC-2 type transport system permease protein